MKKTLFGLFLVLPLVLTGCGSTEDSSNSSASEMQSYTLTEVAQHASSTDCWMIIEGNVYDVTDYIPQHPGRDRILEGCGTDATDLFTGKSTLGHLHSALAKQTLSKYIIGTKR